MKQTVCKVFKIFQCGKYLVAYVLKLHPNVHFSDAVCRINDSAMQTQGPGQTPISWDLSLNFVSLPIF